MAVAFFPLPDFFDELFATELVTADALFRQLALDDHLCGDAGVIGARKPECVEAAHALPAAHDVDQSVDQAVSDVKPSGDVRRWDDDDEARLVDVDDGSEVAFLLPVAVPAL